MKLPSCPACLGVYTVKNGHAHTGRQRYLCRVCGHQFTLHPPQHRISAEIEALVDRLLTERISQRGICRVTGVSRSWFRQHLMKLSKTVQHGFDQIAEPAKKA
jgi:transposase-like protein